MPFGPIQFTGDVDSSRDIKQYNRSGSATAVGDVLIRDFGNNAAESTDTRTALSNAVAAATAILDHKPVVAKSVVADNEEGMFTAYGLARAKVNGAVTAGDYLVAVNAQVYFAAAASGGIAWAIALETQASGTNVLDVILLESPFVAP